MATLVDSQELAAVGEPVARPERRTRSRFFLWLTLACAVVAIGGFMPTYWLQWPAGTFIGSPLLHIHAALATTWIIFLISQSRLVTRGRVRRHMDWGLAGIALASILVVVAVTVAIRAMDEKIAHGGGDAARAFLIVPLTAIGMFAGFTAAAIANVRRPEWHRRFMILGTMGLIEAAMARVFFVMATGGGPGVRPGLMPAPPVSSAVLPGLLLELIIVAGMIHDWRRRGRVHPAWIYGAAIVTGIVLLRVPISGSNAWLTIADALGHISG